MDPKDIISTLDLGRLPSGPRILARILPVVYQPQVQISDVADLFNTDAALAARVVATCNSPHYARGMPTASIREAVLRLGIREVAQLAQAVAMADFKKHPTHLYTTTASHFWERSLHTAFVAERLSDAHPPAYTAGIMHLVGIWVLCSVFPADSHLTIDERELALQARLEEIRMGVSFAQIGGLALEKWQFPQEVCDAVSHQLVPSACPSPRNRATALWLSRAIAATEWHYGAKNEKNLLRADLTIDDLNAINRQASHKVSQIGLG